MARFNMTACIDLTGDEDEGTAAPRTPHPIVIDLTQDDDAPSSCRQLPLPSFTAFIRSNALLDTPQPERFPFRHQTVPPKHSLVDTPQPERFAFRHQTAPPQKAPVAPPKGILLDTPQPERFPFRHQTATPKKPSLVDARRDSLFDIEPDAVVHEPRHGSHAKPSDECRKRIRKLHPPTTEVISLISPSPSPEPPETAPLPQTPSQQSWIQSILRSVTPYPPIAVPRFPGLIRTARRATTRKALRSQVRAHARSLRLGCTGSSLTNPIVILDEPDPTARTDFARLVQDEAVADVLVLFSDGSRLNDRCCGCGVAFWNGQQWTGKAIALGRRTPSSGAAEAMGVAEALHVAAQMLRPEYKVVEIRTDCLRLLHTIPFDHRYPSTLDDKFIEMARTNRRKLNDLGIEVKLTWVKGHSIHAGNEMADYLAKIGSLHSSREVFGGTQDNNLYAGSIAVDKAKLLEMSRRAESVTAQEFMRLGRRETGLSRAVVRAENAERRAGKVRHRLANQREQQMELEGKSMVLRSGAVLSYR